MDLICFFVTFIKYYCFSSTFSQTISKTCSVPSELNSLLLHTVQLGCFSSRVHYNSNNGQRKSKAPKEGKEADFTKPLGRCNRSLWNFSVASEHEPPSTRGHDPVYANIRRRTTKIWKGSHGL